MSHLSQRLKELRGTLSLYEVAKTTGVPKSALISYERGDYSPEKENLKKLADYYEVPYTELRGYYYQDIATDSEELAAIQFGLSLIQAQDKH